MASDLAAFALSLKAWRKSEHINQTEAGRRLGVSQGTVYRWERGEDGVLSDDTARLILEVVGVDPPRARRPPRDPTLPERVARLEEEMAELQARRRPPKKTPSASTATEPAKPLVAPDLHGGAADGRAKRLRRPK